MTFLLGLSKTCTEQIVIGDLLGFVPAALCSTWQHFVLFRFS